jgi:hypothetical protein
MLTEIDRLMSRGRQVRDGASEAAPHRIAAFHSPERVRPRRRPRCACIQYLPHPTSAGRGRVRGTAAGIRSRQLRFAGEFSHQRLQTAVAIRHGCEIAHLARTLFGKRTKRNPGAHGGVLPGPHPGNRRALALACRIRELLPRKLFKPTGWRDTREGCRRSQQMPRLPIAPGASLSGPLHLPIAIDGISDCEVRLRLWRTKTRPSWGPRVNRRRRFAAAAHSAEPAC